MSLVKKVEWPAVRSNAWLSDFFDTDRFFDSDWLRKQTTVPAVNVAETEKNFTIEMAAPGYKKSDFNVHVENGVLTIGTEMKEESEMNEGEFTRREFNYRSFSRSFTLPENVDEDKIEAIYADGLLKLVINKKNLENPKLRKSISIK